MPEFAQREQHQQRGHLVSALSRAVPEAHGLDARHSTAEGLGNQAAQRFAQSCPLRLPSPSACPFGGACHACPARVQAKLKVGPEDDTYEQEADRVADLVLRIPDSNRPRTGPEIGTASIQEGEDELIQTAPADDDVTRRQEEELDEEGEDNVLAKRTGNQPPSPSSALETQIRLLRMGGQPLPRSECDYFEPRFGRGFRQVRIHADERAAAYAHSIGALAFTLGNDIVFGAQQYRPATAPGRRLLAHELVHVVQQTHHEALPAAANTVHRSADSETKTPSIQPLSVQSLIQRDLAILPPRPEAEGRTLTPARMQEAIDYNNSFLSSIPNSAEVIHMIRDVLGLSPEPSVVDADFVNAVLDWQAMYNLTQDGKLGPRTAQRLFREIGAEGVGQGEVKTGPTYTPAAPVVATAGGVDSTSFRFNAEFESDPSRGIFPSCCEVRQFIRWDAAAAASFTAIRGPGFASPHAGFPATHPANTWIEDRNGTDTLRYGHRTGFGPGPGNEYLDSAGRRNQAYGHIYRGRDFPGGPAALAGQWRFLVKVIDVCRGGRTIGTQDVIRINW
jgi:hypothetical protein